MSNIMKKIIWTIIIIALYGIVVLLAKYRPWELSEIRDKYNEAWQCAMDGEYDKAIIQFKLIRQEHDDLHSYNESLYFGTYFCEAMIKYEKGEYRSAKRLVDGNILPKLNDKNNTPNLNKKQKKYVNQKIDAINEKYAEHKAEYDAQDKEAREIEEAARKEREEREAARKKAAPYEGMSESLIDSTDLGKHSKYYAHYNTETISGEIYHASMYYWYKGNDCIFSARCVRGSVWSVWDNRDRKVTNNIVEPGSGNTNKKDNTTEFDPDDHDIDAYYEDFKDEEGFEDIDDAYDDFMDNPEYWDDY